MGHVGSSLALTRSLARFFVLHIRPSPTTGLASSVSFCHAAVSQNRRLWLMCCVKGQSLGVGGWGEGFKWLAIDSAEDISAPLKRRSWRRLESASFVLEILSSGHEPAWRCSDSSSFLACPLPPLSPPPICISCSPYYRLFADYERYIGVARASVCVTTSWLQLFSRLLMTTSLWPRCSAPTAGEDTCSLIVCSNRKCVRVSLTTKNPWFFYVFILFFDAGNHGLLGLSRA